eukprot:scaffold129946_cov45-Prasinocladus_malaysianus.AAC.1
MLSLKGPPPLFSIGCFSDQSFRWHEFSIKAAIQQLSQAVLIQKEDQWQGQPAILAPHGLTTTSSDENCRNCA